MKRLLYVLSAMMLVFVSSYAGNKVEENVPEYFIEGAGTGMQGTYLVNVTVVVKKPATATDDMLARAAVHGVLFKGFANKEMRQSQKPMAGSAAVEASHADYFSNFFKPDGGVSRNYVEIVSSSRKAKKVDKKYHVTATVTVNKEQLRKDLESAGVIRGLNSAF